MMVDTDPEVDSPFGWKYGIISSSPLYLALDASTLTAVSVRGLRGRPESPGVDSLVTRHQHRSQGSHN